MKNNKIILGAVLLLSAATLFGCTTKSDNSKPATKVEDKKTEKIVGLADDAMKNYRIWYEIEQPPKPEYPDPLPKLPTVSIDSPITGVFDIDKGKLTFYNFKPENMYRSDKAIKLGELKGLTDAEIIEKIKANEEYSARTESLEIQGRLSSTGNEWAKETLGLIKIQKIFPTSFVIYDQYYGAVCDFNKYEDVADEVIDTVYVTRTKGETMPFRFDDVDNKYVEKEAP